jgi:hypothetical protein
MPEFKKSTRAGKKYMVKTPSGKWIHFGASGYGQYFDKVPLKLYSHLNHGDKKRRENYRNRHMAIKLKDGTPAYKNKEQPAYWSWRYLWT